MQQHILGQWNITVETISWRQHKFPFFLSLSFLYINCVHFKDSDQTEELVSLFHYISVKASGSWISQTTFNLGLTWWYLLFLVDITFAARASSIIFFPSSIRWKLKCMFMPEVIVLSLPNLKLMGSQASNYHYPQTIGLFKN